MNGMTPEEFQNYLGLLSRLLRLKATEREAIAEELRSHLEERLAALTAAGIEPTRAVSMALAEFGDAAALAAEFTAVSRIYKRRWIMRLTVGSIAASVIAAAVVISFWPGGPVQSSLAVAQAEQAEKDKQTPAPIPEKLDANAQTRLKLEKFIDVDFVDMPLIQVIDRLSEITDVQFQLDIRLLSDVGITSDTPITREFKHYPAEMVLRLILRDLGLTYLLDNGVVIVTTPEEAETILETRVYRIDDLVPSRLVKEKETAANTGENKINVDYDGLIDLITSTVKPTTWDAVGGPGSLAPYRGTLVISQTQDVHREIQKLLKDLRESINPEIVDESTPQNQKSAGGRMGGGMGGMRVMEGMGGGMGMFGPSNKKTEEKDTTKPAADKQQKDSGGGGGGGTGGNRGGGGGSGGGGGLGADYF
jgi:uncharacterized membrane protein YgcG